MRYSCNALFIIYFTTHITNYAERSSNQNTHCFPPRGETCVEIRQCPFFVELLDKSPIPRPRNVIKIIREHQCGFQGKNPKVCCFGPNSYKGQSDISNSSVRLLPTDNCGRTSNDFRITSGASTAPMEFPWMALLLYYVDNQMDFKCAGTLINGRYVLTAAHCVFNLTLIGVRLGEHNINTDLDCDKISGRCSPPVQDFYIENVTVHPEYNPATSENDIALIRLATTANLTYENVQPICLPVDETANTNLKGKFVVVAGWGVTETGYRSTELLKTSIPVIPNDECQTKYKNPISYKQICAGGYQGRDSCGGDSGGPLKQLNYFNGEPHYVQYGIVSYGPKFCGTKGQPAVYTNIIHYMKWISDNLKPFLD